jgi:phosphate transport system permease protein
MTAAILILIAFYLVFESSGALASVGLARFFSDASWHPAPLAVDGFYNLVPMLAGTALCTIGAIALAGPLGICSAVFCQYYAPRPVARLYRHLVSLLAGIPSVVYGFWGLVVLVPLIRAVAPPGPSLIAGILILTVMILPTVALIAESSLESIPESYLQGASALGMTRFATIVGVALPAARSGLMAASILGASRALGETMAILMVCGNIVAMPDSLFDPVRTLTANIALEMAYAVGDHRSSLFVTGLALLGMIVVMVAGTDRLSRNHVGEAAPRA